MSVETNQSIEPTGASPGPIDGIWQMFSDGLQELIDYEREVPVRAPRDAAELASELSLELEDRGISPEQVIAELVRVGKATPATSTNQFFNQLFGGRIELATIAEMFAAFLNTSMYTYKVAGPQVLIERTVMDLSLIHI